MEEQLKENQGLQESLGILQNVYRLPADWDKAYSHQQACQVGRPVANVFNEVVCECCGKQVIEQKLELGCSLDSLNYLGSAYNLYFVFIKALIFFLIITLFSSFYSIYVYNQGTFCLPFNVILDKINANKSLTINDFCAKSFIT